QPKPKKPRKPRRKKKKVPGEQPGGDDVHVNPRGGARGDMDVHDGQDVDPAAADTWIGSGEGVKLFSEVFGAFLPAEGAAVVHHAGGGGGEVQPGGGGIGFNIGGSAHGGINIGPVHAQGGVAADLHRPVGHGGRHLGRKATH